LIAIFWVLRSGALWRDLPERHGPWQTIYHRFNAWRKDGTVDKLIETMQVRLDEDWYIDWDLRSDQLEYHKGRPLLFDRETYRQRSAIENCVGWPKECRRIATRFEKLALNFLAMLKLAIIQRYLRIAFSDRVWPGNG
jgi:transposase